MNCVRFWGIDLRHDIADDRRTIVELAGRTAEMSGGLPTLLVEEVRLRPMVPKQWRKTEGRHRLRWTGANSENGIVRQSQLEPKLSNASLVEFLIDFLLWRFR